MSRKQDVLHSIRSGLIVSCQALEDEPLHGSDIMARMAIAAKMGGAVGIRANTVKDIQAIQEVVDLPIIGIIKEVYPDSDVYITPTMKEVDALLSTGVEIIALDATQRPRPKGEKLASMVEQIRQKSDVLLMADVSTYEEGVAAAELGFDLIGTTLSGYTPYSPQTPFPDFELIERLSKNLDVPIIAEGKVTTPEQARKCLEKGAFALVVGGAITRPQQITKRFVEEISQ